MRLRGLSGNVRQREFVGTGETTVVREDDKKKDKKKGEDRKKKARTKARATDRDPYIRAENEDDDGYDPYSDRQPRPEPLFERDPWA